MQLCLYSSLSIINLYKYIPLDSVTSIISITSITSITLHRFHHLCDLHDSSILPDLPSLFPPPSSLCTSDVPPDYSAPLSHALRTSGPPDYLRISGPLSFLPPQLRNRDQPVPTARVQANLKPRSLPCGIHSVALDLPLCLKF